MEEFLFFLEQMEELHCREWRSFLKLKAMQLYVTTPFLDIGRTVDLYATHGSQRFIQLDSEFLVRSYFEPQF